MSEPRVHVVDDDEAMRDSLKWLLESRGLDGLSIGFKTLRARRDRATASRLLTEIDLWEISLVTFPMLLGARVSFVATSERVVE